MPWSMRPLAVVPLVVLLVACGAAHPTPTTPGGRTWRGVPLPEAAVVVAEERDSIMLDVSGAAPEVAASCHRRWRAAVGPPGGRARGRPVTSHPGGRAPAERAARRPARYRFSPPGRRAPVPLSL